MYGICVRIFDHDSDRSRQIATYPRIARQRHSPRGCFPTSWSPGPCCSVCLRRCNHCGRSLSAKAAAAVPTTTGVRGLARTSWGRCSRPWWAGRCGRGRVGWSEGRVSGSNKAQLYSCQKQRRSIAGRKSSCGRAEQSMHGMGAGNEVDGSGKDFSWSGDAREVRVMPLTEKCNCSQRRVPGHTRTAKERQVFTLQGAK
jgi:hypothetical protein